MSHGTHILNIFLCQFDLQTLKKDKNRSDALSSLNVILSNNPRGVESPFRTS